MILRKVERQSGYLRSLAELIVKSKSHRSIWSRTSYWFVDSGTSGGASWQQKIGLAFQGDVAT